uniref:ATPase, F1 complex, epsilon subunit n=1 Tax=Schistosoma japonicum TaxID=6182 RepID=C1LP16_SCHJA|nr:ATPase, F1 complex, epsilon subunit [Schistosoma japonicum]CAX76443.1 ATPase, F1 complex, epsilon subunit [Schistosoma japonicum]CAX76444.1 ATPase, F1 complex, epsilon subunit [Schistosoma japonicum]
MSLWRSAGISYIRYSSICAKAVRECLKSEYKLDASKRIGKHIKVTNWKEGKPIRNVS